MSNEAHKQQPQQQPQAGTTHYDPSADLEIPVMAPRARAYPPPQPPETDAERARRQRQHERETRARDQQREPDDRALERERLVGQRPVQGMGAPQPFPAETILNKAHGLLEQYQRDKTSIDPVFVQIMVLQALGTYGSQAARVSQLTQEVGRLRKVLERRWGDEDDQGGGEARGGGKTTGERARARINERGGPRRGGVFGRLRGRAR